MQLKDLFPGQLAATPQSVGLALLEQARQTTNNQLATKRFPFPTVRIGGKRMVLIQDIQRVLDEAKQNGDRPLIKRRPGRPTKAEAVARAKTREESHG